MSSLIFFRLARGAGVKSRVYGLVFTGLVSLAPLYKSKPNKL